MTRFLALSAILATGCTGVMAMDAASELTSDTGWLTLVGLVWLDKGANSFGRAASNHTAAPTDNHACAIFAQASYNAAGKNDASCRRSSPMSAGIAARQFQPT